MQIKITKNTNKPHVICYTRTNLSVTWMHTDHFFILHDLSHYALEKTLNFKTAFMGMLDNGWEINDFENREKRRSLSITEEAWYAENMANLFLTEYFQGQFEDFNATSNDTFKMLQLPYPPLQLDDNTINTIRKQLSALIASWNTLPEGETLTLLF